MSPLKLLSALNPGAKKAAAQTLAAGGRSWRFGRAEPGRDTLARFHQDTARRRAESAADADLLWRMHCDINLDSTLAILARGRSRRWLQIAVDRWERRGQRRAFARQRTRVHRLLVPKGSCAKQTVFPKVPCPRALSSNCDRQRPWRNGAFVLVCSAVAKPFRWSPE